LQERRIFPNDIRKHNIRTLILTVVLIAVLLVLPWLWKGLSFGSAFVWVITAVFFAMIAVLQYYAVRLRKSLAKPVVPEKTHYEARGLDPITPALIVLFVLMSIMSLAGPLLSLLQGDYEHLYLLVVGLVWPAAIVLIIIRAFRLRFSVEENGLVLRDSVIPSMPPKYFPFEELIYLNVEGRTLVYRSRSKSVWGKLIVRDPVKLKAVLREVYRG
jgi:hypothetical protein